MVSTVEISRSSKDDNCRWLVEFVDLLLPLLTPYQAVVYLLLHRLAVRDGEQETVRVGKRTIAASLGKGSRGAQGNYRQISAKLTQLASIGCISILDTNRNGTSYIVRQPREVPAVRERLAVGTPEPELDYYRDPSLRRALFERDRWLCRYCGDVVMDDAATLDHVVPVSKGGEHTAENLVTCCLTCNSIKAGRSYDDAAPQILAALRQRLELRQASRPATTTDRSGHPGG